MIYVVIAGAAVIYIGLCGITNRLGQISERLKEIVDVNALIENHLHELPRNLDIQTEWLARELRELRVR